MLTIDDWNDKFNKAGLGHHWDRFRSLLKHEIRILPQSVDESKIDKGQSKIGGRPDLPKNHAWPKEDSGKSLSFLAQFNFRDASVFDKSGQLPKSGIILFFYSAEQDAWGFDPADNDKFKVLYFDSGLTEIERVDFPADVPNFAKYKSCTLEFASSVSIPNWETNSISQILTDKEQDAYLEFDDDGDITKLLGHSDNIQGPMEEECQLVTNKINAGGGAGWNTPRAKELMKGAHLWTLLFQIDSIEQAGMMWGDVGRIYFWIKKEDLLNQQFDKVWFSLQCC